MRLVVLLAAIAALLITSAVNAASPTDLERLVTLTCGKHMEFTPYAEDQTRELCQTEFVEDGKQYVVTYWIERHERSIQVSRNKLPALIVETCEWLTFSIIEIAQFEHFDYGTTGAILEQWASVDRHTGLVRGGMHGYAFRGGFDPPFDRYHEAELPETLETGLGYRDKWQTVLDQAVRIMLIRESTPKDSIQQASQE